MKTVWVPVVSSPSLAAALSVSYRTNGLIDPGLYRVLLASKLDALIQANPQEALSAMQMSSEHAPGLWSISQQSPTKEWGEAIVRSDQVDRILAGLSWQGITKIFEEEQSLREILELFGDDWPEQKARTTRITSSLSTIGSTTSDQTVEGPISRAQLQKSGALTLALAIVVHHEKLSSDQPLDTTLLLNAVAWKTRCLSGYRDDLLVVGVGFENQFELAAALKPYGLSEAAVNLRGYYRDVLPDDSVEDFCRAVGATVRKWSRSNHPGAIPVLSWGVLIPDTTYTSEGWWWAGVEAAGDQDEGNASVLRKLLPATMTVRASTWTAILESFPSETDSDVASQEYSNSVMRIALAQWLCRFDAAAHNSSYNFSTAGAVEFSGVDLLRLGFEAARYHFDKLKEVFEGLEEAGNGLSSACLLAILEARTESLRHFLSNRFEGDSALLWSLYSATFQAFDKSAGEGADDLWGLRNVDMGDVEDMWTLVVDG